MRNTAEVCLAAGGAKPPKSISGSLKQCKKRRKTLFSSLRLITFVLQMYKQLTSEQRYIISALLQNKMTLSFIAGAIGVSVSTVSREIKRNSNENGVYNSRTAVLKLHRRRSKSLGNRSVGTLVRSRVFELIRKEQWSLEEVAGQLGKEEGLKVSKSTIYNWIAACSPHHKDNIRRHLRRGGRKTKSSYLAGRSFIPSRVSIDDRPAHADGR